MRGHQELIAQCGALGLNELAARGLVRETGKPLSPSRFDEMLLNPLDRGRIIRSDWEINVTGEFTPLVPDDVWRRANATRKPRSKKA
jgi:hypothetical protein